MRINGSFDFKSMSQKRWNIWITCFIYSIYKVASLFVLNLPVNDEYEELLDRIKYITTDSARGDRYW